MARQFAAALAGALFVSVAWAADRPEARSEGCASGASCPADFGDGASRAAVLQDTPSGEDIAVELLQSNKGRKESHPSVAALSDAAGALMGVNGSLLAKSVGEALAKKGNVSMPSAEELIENFHSRYMLSVADILRSAIEDSLLPNETIELASQELSNSSSSTLVALETAVKGSDGIFDLSDFMNSMMGSLPGFDTIKDQFGNVANDMMNKAKEAAGSSAASTIKDKFGIDISDFGFDIPGVTGGTSCSQDTGGTCTWSGCAMSRNAQCKNGKCMCPSGECANGGRCGCSVDTGGTCQLGGCSMSRGASCKNGKCICTGGKCAKGGKCE